jgi:hypothetical protein
MKICVVGEGHLAETTLRAARLRGFDVCRPTDGEDRYVELWMVAVDVLDHAKLDDADRVVGNVVEGDARALGGWGLAPVVLLSQVPPGYTRKWAERCPKLYYQVDTIIVKEALPRMVYPEQIVVGCADPDAGLPIAYQEYLMAHDCPVHQMSYESAELAKCAINYALAAQIDVANRLAEVAAEVGARYEDVEIVLRGDARIGPHAYLRPGAPNQHLNRDVTTINRRFLSSGRLGAKTAGSKAAGGRARAEALSPERRSEIAQKAAQTRWGGET